MPSPMGTLYITCQGDAITGLWIDGQAHFPDLSNFQKCDDEPALMAAKLWIGRYLQGEKPDPKDLLLMPEGTPFQRKVWDQLKTIPYGQTVSYGQIASAIGKPKAFQAVGNAIGRNPISIIIPCHRVIGSDGRLTGYAGGLPAKQYLLELESHYI